MNDDEHFIVNPQTAEEMLLAIGAVEDGEISGIILTSELIADLCVRLVRLEDKLKEDDE